LLGAVDRVHNPRLDDQYERGHDQQRERSGQDDDPGTDAGQTGGWVHSDEDSLRSAMHNHGASIADEGKGQAI
jgi:hypothetical protein